ncbi:MAG: glycosyltransferase family 39 protein [bacterium]|nr:glycosyltransferase family 39 protein [bacterium]
MKRLLEKKYLYFIGTYISFMMFIVFAATGYGIATQISKTIAILMFGMFLFSKHDENKIAFEKTVLSVFIFVFNALMLMRGKMQGDYEIYNIICGIALLLVTGIYLWRNHGKTGIKKWLCDNKVILLVIACFVFLSVEVVDSFVMWDAWQYYASGSGCIREITKLADSNLSGIYGLFLWTHKCLGYSLYAVMSQLIAEGSASVQIADIILAAVSIFAYYQIVRKLFDKKYTDETAALATVPYALSPFVLGIIGNINLDSATMYFAVIFIACSLYHYEALELVFAFAFCFTKEPAVIYYVAYIIAKVVCDYLSEHKFTLWGIVRYGFCHIKNYLYAVPGIVWMILLLCNPGGGGPVGKVGQWSHFEVSPEIAPLKLRQIFFMNFNWIFWLMIIFGIVLCIKKIQVNIKIFNLIPISIMGLSVIGFGCIYVTYLLPRYIVPIIPALYLTATAVIGHTNKRNLQIFTVLVSALLFVQNYTVIDPVMKGVFSSRQIGYESNSAMYVIGDEYNRGDRFDDHIVYNRQNIYWPETITEALRRSGYNGNMLIVLPDDDPSPQYDIFGNTACLWNTRTKKLEYYDESLDIPQGCTMITVCRASDASDRVDDMSNNYILYVVPAWTSMDPGFIAGKEMIKQGEVEHKGWGVQYMVMDMGYMPIEGGDYLVSPKQDDSLSICTDGSNLLLEHNAAPLNLKYEQTRYEFVFDEYDAAVDVKYSRVDENGTVWLWENTGADSQRWYLEEAGDYYMICWHGYALTYDLTDNSIRLTPKNGEDNQLWSFAK